MAEVMPRYAAAFVSVRSGAGSPPLPYVSEPPLPVRLTRHEQVRNSLAVCALSKVMDARRRSGKATVERHWRRARIEPKTRTKYRAGAWATDFVRILQKRHNHNQYAGRPCFYLAFLIGRPTSTLNYEILRLFTHKRIRFSLH
jgi:hypothetical protein